MSPPRRRAIVRLQVRAALIIGSQAPCIILKAVRLSLEVLGQGAATWRARLRAHGEGFSAARQCKAAIPRPRAQEAGTWGPDPEPSGQATIAWDIAGLGAIGKATSTAEVGSGERGCWATTTQKEMPVQGPISKRAKRGATVQQGESVRAQRHLAYCPCGHSLHCLGDLTDKKVAHGLSWL